MPLSASSNRPRFCAVRVGEGALLVAEEFALQQRLRDGRAVDGQERLGLAQALIMHRLGDQILAGAVFAFNQDGRRFAHRDTPHEAEHFAHGLGFGDDLRCAPARLPR